MLSACEDAVAGAKRDLDFTRLHGRAFGACPSDSIDYAVMEKTRDAVVVPLDAGWSDVGSWSALQDALPRDASGNVTAGDVITEGTTGCYLHSTSRLIAAVGLKDHVVVETKDAVLVAPRDRVQDVKALVNQLKAQGRYETSLHREVFRPWGSYDSIDNGERFQVKRLVVKPGAPMSLQLHHHRAEHWIVVSGTARITRGEETFLLGENESTYIPMGTKHRIENPGKVTLHIIEVQSGSYLGEDDIVRFEDVYGREGTSNMNPITISGFKAYDLRGRIPGELNEDVAYRIGRAYAEFVKPKKVIVGRDIRLSSEELCTALDAGPARLGRGRLRHRPVRHRGRVLRDLRARRWTAASWSRRATTRRTTTA